MPRTPRISRPAPFLAAALLTLIHVLLAPPSAGAQSQVAFSTFLGGSLWDEARDLAVDAQGNVWVTGPTASRDFPAAGEPPEPVFYIDEPVDGFLVRLSPAGDLLASDYLGTEFQDEPRSLALDSAGNPWEAGLLDGQPDFAVLLARGADAWYYQRFSSFDDGRDVAVDGAGNVYVLAGTDDEFFGFDLFVDKRSPAGATLYVTGSGLDNPQALAVDPAGFAYVLAGNSDFLKLDPAGSQIPFAPQLPGLPGIADIAVDPAGNLHVVGTRAEQLFYARLSPQGQLLAALDFGGSGGDFGRRIALGPAGDVVLLGATDSADLPLVAPVDDDCPPGGAGRCRTTVFVVRLVGAAVAFSSYLPIDLQVGDGEATAVGLGPDGSLYVAGRTSNPDFPTVNAVQPALSGPSDAFVLRILADQPPACGGAIAQPSTLWPANGKLVPIAIQGIADPEGGAVEITVTSIRQDEPLARPGTPDGTGAGIAVPQVRAGRSAKGDGRVYTIGFEARDAAGAVCTGTVRVCVPHDQGRRRVCGDGGALFDSTGG